MICVKHKNYWKAAAVPVLGIFLLVAFWCFSGASAQAREITIIDEIFARFIEPQAGTISDDEWIAQEVLEEDSFFQDLVLAVYVDKTKLSSGIFAVQDNARNYLPIAALSDILGFSVEIDRDRRYVEGWSVSEDRRYSIDEQNKTISYRDKTVKLPPEAVLQEDIAGDDIYVLLDVLTQIWPVDFQVDVGALILRVYPDSKLPFQRALERQARQKRVADARQRRENEAEEDYPFVANPYKLIGKPALDIDAQAGYDGRQDTMDYRATVSGAQDLLYAGADYSATIGHKNGKIDKPENIRFRLRRQSIHEGALPLGLEDAQLGDVRLDNRQLISSGLSGRGFIFTTEENHRSNEFDLITVEGIGVAGWDAELYVNDQLIEFSTVDARGEYRFEDVSIGYGNNRVRVVLYGPQGQIREHVENYFFQSNMVKAGEFQISGGVVDSQRDLIPIEERKTGRPEGLAANVYGAYGVNKYLTAFGSLNTLKDDEGTDEISREYASVGVAGSLGGTLGQVELYKQLDGGTAVDVRTLSDFKGFKVNTQAALYRDFESPDAGNGLNRKEFEAEGTVKKVFASFLGALGLEAGVDYLKRKNDTTRTRYTTRQSLGLGGARVTHQTRTNITNSDHTATTGRLTSTVRMKDWRLRGSLNYNSYPSFEKTSIQGELRYGKIRDFSTAFRLQQNFVNDETIAGVQITKDFEKFLGSVDANWSSEDGVSMMLRASTALGPYGIDGDYIMRSDPLRQAGPVVSHLFVDKDYDGVFGEGDEPLPETKVTIGRRITKQETDPDGYILELNPAAGGKTNVAVAQSSIDDPYLVPAVAGYSVYPRPGAVQRLEFPIIETGAIDGTVRFTVNGDPVIGVDLELLKNDGEIAQKTTTAPDGYFTFERIPPGEYTIRAAPESGVNIPHKHVSLTTDNLFQFGMDINVIDLNTPVDSGLQVAVADDGMLNAKSILSIAKGFKDKGKKMVAKVATPASASASAVVPVSGVVKKEYFGQHGASTVTGVRIGQHPDKIRMVMDLTSLIDYTLTHDPASNTIFVDMPMGTWTARKQWERSSNKYFLHNYRVEQLPDRGVRLMLGVEDGVQVKAFGLLNAQGGKKDRLYIDVEKQ